MATNGETVGKYLDFALLQLGAESYLHGVNLGDAPGIIARWQYGFNDPTHPFIDPEYTDPKTGLKTGRAAAGPNDGFDVDGTALFGPNKAVLPAYNRMVRDQAVALTRRFDVIDHHADDATGFSATLYRNSASGEYTLSFRSTEFRAWDTAGDNPRDDVGANQEGIRKSGFAFAQLASMEDYWRHIRNGERWLGNQNAPGGTWVAGDPDLSAFKAAMDARQQTQAGGKLFVTGYSLGGHLASVFTLMHESEVEKAFVYNAAGHGIMTNAGGTEIAGGTTGSAIAAMLAEFTRALRDPSSIVLDDRTFGASGSTWRQYWTRSQARAVDSANRLRDPFASENGIVDKAIKGNVYDSRRDDRYAFASEYLLLKYPTASLATSILGAAPGVIGGVLQGYFSVGAYAAAGSNIQANKGSQIVAEGVYTKIVFVTPAAA